MEKFMEVLIAALDADMAEILDMDDILAGRESSPFDDEWMRVNGAIETLQPENDSAKSEKYRREAFMKAFKKTCDDDLSAYISDDIGLIYSALTLRYHDNWLNGMVKEYCSGRIPYGKVIEEEKPFWDFDCFRQ